MIANPIFIVPFLFHPKNSSLDTLTCLFLVWFLFVISILPLGIPKMQVEIILDMESQVITGSGISDFLEFFPKSSLKEILSTIFMLQVVK